MTFQNIPQDTINHILENYPKVLVTIASLSRELGISSFVIRRILTQNEINLKPTTITNRKYEVDDEFFDEIDTEEKAYFLGWMYADGCHFPHKNTLVLQLQERDREILEKLKNLFQPTRPLIFSPVNQGNAQNKYSLLLVSERISKKMLEYGLTPRKTWTLEWPEWLEERLWGPFIRGFFDGDGCLGMEGKVVIVGNSKFCNRLHEIIEMKCNNFAYIRPDRRTEGLIRIEITGIYNSKKFLDFIYEGATIFLERKYERYQNVIHKCSLCKRAPYTTRRGKP